MNIIFHAAALYDMGARSQTVSHSRHWTGCIIIKNREFRSNSSLSWHLQSLKLYPTLDAMNVNTLNLLEGWTGWEKGLRCANPSLLMSLINTTWSSSGESLAGYETTFVDGVHQDSLITFSCFAWEFAQNFALSNRTFATYRDCHKDYFLGELLIRDGSDLGLRSERTVMNK